MALKDLNDDQLKELLENPEQFLKKKENLDLVLSFNSSAKRRFADILKYDLKLSDEEIRQKLEEVAAIKLKEIEVFNDSQAQFNG